MAPETQTVAEGEDGWLFLVGGSNKAASNYDRVTGETPDAKIAEWRKILEQRRGRCALMGVRYIHCVIPDKLTVYGDKLRPPIDPALSPLARLLEASAESPAAPLDLITPLRTERETQALYWRTDTHLTPEGCLVIYRELCRAAGWTSVDNLLERPFERVAAFLDLGGKLHPPRLEDFRSYCYTRDARRIWTNAIVKVMEDPVYQQAVHVGGRARFRNEGAANRGRVLIFGDSYAGPGPNGLTAMLAETISDVEFVWSTAIDWSLVRRSNPDVLIAEIAERFMTLTPADRLSLWKLEFQQMARAWVIRRRLWQAQIMQKS